MSFEHELKNAYIGNPYTVQTFDFQNDGVLNWTGVNVYGQPNYVTGQGWTIGNSSTSLYQSVIKPPTSVYQGTLKKIKIYMYKGIAWSSYPPDNHAVGAGLSTTASSLNPNVLYGTNQGTGINLYDGSNHITTTQDIIGEITQEYIFDDDNSLTFIINGTYEYDLGNYATTFSTLWDNQTLGIGIGRWRANDGTLYIRKVEITTEP